MIRLIAYDAQTFFEGLEHDLEEHLFPALRVRDKNGYWKARYLLKRMAYFSDIPDKADRDEQIEKIYDEHKWLKFYDRRTDSFMTGLLPQVLERFKKHDVLFKLIDKRVRFQRTFEPVKDFRFQDKTERRQEQIDAVNAALKEKRGILHMATNAGKTECAAGIIAAWESQVLHKVNVLFLVHRVGLVKQTAERFMRHLKNEIYTLGGGQKDIPERGILVATIQTALNVLDQLEDFLQKCDILFIDEFHINKAWACTKVVKKCLAPMRFGLSGTIAEKNKAKMFHYVGMTGPIISRVSNEELVILGRSAKPIARFLEVNTKRIPDDYQYSAAYNRGIVSSAFRNSMVVKEVIRHVKKERRVLVTVARIQHGRTLKRMLERKIDLPVEFIHGGTPLRVREAVLKKFRAQKLHILIASPIFDVGMDVPEIEGWVNAAGGIGWELVLQRLGRVLRRKEGENKVYISDFVDKHNEYLFKHSLARMKHYLNEKIVKIKIV